MRIDAQPAAQHTAQMEKEIDDELMEEAELLALSAFGQHAEYAHIEAVYERLLANRQLGLDWFGTVTLH